MGHVLGLPDLYDTDQSSNGIGARGLLGYGVWHGPQSSGTKPSHPDAWSKLVLGWVEPTTVYHPETGMALPAFDQNPVVLKVPVDPYQDGVSWSAPASGVRARLVVALTSTCPEMGRLSCTSMKTWKTTGMKHA
jgi:M6 family metalloprotease-like protein